MKDRIKIKIGKFLPALSLTLLLLGGSLLLVACGGAEKDTLKKQVAEFQEKAESLEQKLSDRDGRIKKLEEEQIDLLGRIPESHIVAPGESHWQIAYDFLTTKKNVPPEKAGNVLAGTVLFDKILAGFRLWNYFGDNTYGTFLTKGEAVISPGQLRRTEKQDQEKEKQKLMDENSSMRIQAAELEKKNTAELEKWKGEQKTLQDRIQSLNADLSTEKDQRKNYESRLNSVYYLAGHEDALKASGKVKGTFLGLSGDRIKNVTYSDFQKSLDLRNSDTIALTAEEFGLSRIRGVKILPRDLKEGKDFRFEITADGRTAKVHIQDKDKFLLARIIFVLD